jgi:hypothetical protein
MNYDINEKETSIDNMEDTLFQRLLSLDDIGNAKAIHDEWVVGTQDPRGGEYIFLFIQNFTLQTWHDPNDENINHRVELTCDNDGVFITSSEKAVREDISIAQKDLAIAVAKAILEAYGEVWWIAQSQSNLNQANLKIGFVILWMVILCVW